MRTGAYLLSQGLYLWHPDLCPSCRRERDPGVCHLCEAPVHPKTWADLRKNPPPWDPLVGEVEELAARVVAERRVIRSELAMVLEPLSLGRDDAAIAERLVLAYVAGAAREERRRHDNLRAQPTGAQGQRQNAVPVPSTTYRNPS